MNKNSIAPVKLLNEVEDSVTHSLRVLSRIYNYNHWIFSMIHKRLGMNVLEVGAGIGNITSFMLNVDRLTCLEPQESMCRYLSERFRNHHNVNIILSRIEDCPNDDVREGVFDTVVCLNVLEHISEDIKFLGICRELLKRDGNIVLLVPAIPLIYGAIDDAMGHCRRYTRKTISAALEKSGFTVESAKYMNFPGIFGWWWQGCVRRWSVIPEKGAVLFDRLVPFVSAMETLVPPLIGQSIVALGRKNVDDSIRKSEMGVS